MACTEKRGINRDILERSVSETSGGVGASLGSVGVDLAAKKVSETIREDGSTPSAGEKAIIEHCRALTDQAKVSSQEDGNRWFQVLTSSPIVPGQGMAQVQLGMRESEMLQILGTPTEGTKQVIGYGNDIALGEEDRGETLYYSTGYEKSGVFLGVYTHRNERKVQSLRLYCHELNSVCRQLPTVSGIGIGSPMWAVEENLGEARSVRKYDGIDGEHTVLQFQGIELDVDAGGLVHTIDIP